MLELRRRLREGTCLILDGGLGTMLLARGLLQGDAPERMNLERPEIVRAVHHAYVEAGSEAIHTNSFGANPLRLARFGLAARCVEVNRRAVEIARDAGPSYVLGDIGPTGEYLPPVGQADPQSWRDAYPVQAKALLNAGVDGIHIETMSDLREALIALEAVRELSDEIPVMVSLAFDRKKKGFFTLMGDSLVEALVRVADGGADAVGANCNLVSADMADLARRALTEVQARITIQPNAGQPRSEGAELRYDQRPGDFANELLDPIRNGLAAVGGCCGTDPRFIRSLAERMGRAQ